MRFFVMHVKPRQMGIILYFMIVILFTGCGGSTKNSSSGSAGISGNWQMNLLPSSQNLNPAAQSGFLLDTNGALSGGMMFSNPVCSGIGNVSGSVNGSNITFTVTPTGLNLAFTGSMTQPNIMSGNYTILSTGCSGLPSGRETGTWTANLVTPLNGSFQQGSAFVSNEGVTYPISGGQLSQGSNTGVTVANLAGTLSTTGYCFFTTTNVTGAISGTSVVLNLVGSSGTQVGQMSGTISVDGTSFTGTYRLFGLGAGNPPPCVNGDSGTVNFTL